MSDPKSPSDIDRYVGLQVRKARRARKWTQEKLANDLGITFQQVQKYEKGVNRVSAGRLHQFARVLDRPLTYFYPDVDFGEREFQEADDAVEAHELRGEIRKALPRIEDLTVLRALAAITQMACQGTQNSD